MDMGEYKVEHGSSSNKRSKDWLKLIEDNLRDLPPITRRCCIYRVPKILRGINPEAYTPMAVPIGPFHRKEHGQEYCSRVVDSDLFSNGLYKLKCLKYFVEQSGERCQLKTYLEMVKARISEISACYADDDKIFDDVDYSFTKMILLDSVFIILLFGEHIFAKEGMDIILMSPIKVKEIVSDIMLAENQLPFFILEVVYEKFFDLGLGHPPTITFLDIACQFLKIDKGKFKDAHPLHLLDMLRISLIPPSPDRSRRSHDGNSTLDLELEINDPVFPRTWRKPDSNIGIVLHEITCPTATGLFEAGIKFKVKEDPFSFLDICFDVKKGILYIPKLRVEDGTECRFRNLIAFEQSHTQDYTYMTDYQFFLDCLINTATDVQLLTKSGIIENWLGCENNLSDLINSMGKYSYNFSGGYLYSRITTELNSYHKKKWNRYRAILKQVYFSHPWAVIPFGYAVFLLLLTVIQTVGTILAMPGVIKQNKTDGPH